MSEESMEAPEETQSNEGGIVTGSHEEDSAVPQVDPNNPTPHQQFLGMLPEELREEAAFKDFKGEDVNEIIGKLGKSYLNTKKLVGADKDALLKIPGGEDIDGWDEVYDKLGRPEDVAGYELGELAESDFIDGEDLNELLQVAHKKGASKDLMNAIFSKYVEQTQGKINAAKESAEENAIKWDQQLQSEWGEAYDQKAQKIRNTLKAKAGDEFFSGITKEGYINVDSPAFVKMIDNIIAASSEDSGPTKGSTSAEAALTPAEARAEISAMEGDQEVMKIMMNAQDPRRDALLQKRVRLFEMANA